MRTWREERNFASQKFRLTPESEQESDSQIWKISESRLKNFGTGAESCLKKWLIIHLVTRFPQRRVAKLLHDFLRSEKEKVYSLWNVETFGQTGLTSFYACELVPVFWSWKKQLSSLTRERKSGTAHCRVCIVIRWSYASWLIPSKLSST